MTNDNAPNQDELDDQDELDPENLEALLIWEDDLTEADFK